VWDLESGACLHTLEGHIYKVQCVSVMPAGQHVVSGSLDETLRVWDLESGACLHTLGGHTEIVTTVSVAPDGRRAVSGSNDKTLRVWDMESGQCLRTLGGHSDWVWAVTVTPDGWRVVSGSMDQTLRVWDLKSGTCLRTFEGHKIYAVAVAGRGNTICAGTDTGAVFVLKVRAFQPGPTILTAAGLHGTRCPACGSELEPPPLVVTTITSLCGDLTPQQRACLDLPASAFSDPRLLSQCPRCDSPLKFNPFTVDNRNRY